MGIGIVCDSSLNVPEPFLQEYGIREVPALVIFGPDEVYRNKVDLSIEAFYRRFLEEGQQPTTSQPTPAQFLDAYREVPEETILCLTVTAKLSGTYNSAVQAAAMAAEEGRQVTVWDTRFASMGGGWQVVMAARWAHEGLELSTILERLGRIRDHTFGFLTVETLTYLARAGRISHTRAYMGNVLNVKPLLAFRDGALEVIGRARGRRRSKEALVRLVAEQVGDRPVRLAVVHTHIPDEAEALLHTCRERFHVVEDVVVELGPVLAAIGGPGLLGITGYPVEVEG